MKNLVFTFVGLAPRFRPSRTGGPTCLRAAPCSRSRFAGPGPRRASRSPTLARPSLRHAATAAEKFRRVATSRRRRPPRGSRGLTSRPRARLHLLVPVRSLTPARAAFLLLQSREPRAPPSPRPQLRRRRSPAPPRHSPIPRARNSASPSFKPRSSLRRLPCTGRASPRFATDGHGAAVLGRHGSRLPSPLQPRLATLPRSPSPSTARALTGSPCRGRRWPPAAGRAAPPRQRAPQRGTLPPPARPARPKAAVGRGPARPPRSLFAQAAQADYGRGPVRFHGLAQ